MKIKILRTVILDIEGKQKTYSPSGKIIEISDELAKENNYVERYGKYPRHIQIVEFPKVEEKPKEVDQKVNDEQVEEKPKTKKATKTKE